MHATDKRTYLAREFAQLAGVSVPALHHYDRLGLLRPRRTDAGHRVYTTRDLEVLEQIVALRFIGVPLRRIPILRGADPELLASAMRAQRAALAEKRRLLDQAIEAIGTVEAALAGGTPVDAALFRRIIEVIGMQNNGEEWKKKYDALVEAKIDRLKSLSPELMAELRGQWNVLIGDVQRSLHGDPAGPKAQQLATRWVALLERLIGGKVSPAMMGHAAAVPDGSDWPSSIAARVDPRVWEFMRRVFVVRGAGAQTAGRGGCGGNGFHTEKRSNGGQTENTSHVRDESVPLDSRAPRCRQIAGRAMHHAPSAAWIGHVSIWVTFPPPSSRMRTRYPAVVRARSVREVSFRYEVRSM